MEITEENRWQRHKTFLFVYHSFSSFNHPFVHSFIHSFMFRSTALLLPDANVKLLTSMRPWRHDQSPPTSLCIPIRQRGMPVSHVTLYGARALFILKTKQQPTPRNYLTWNVGDRLDDIYVCRQTGSQTHVSTAGSSRWTQTTLARPFHDLLMYVHLKKKILSTAGSIVRPYSQAGSGQKQWTSEAVIVVAVLGVGFLLTLLLSIVLGVKVATLISSSPTLSKK